MAIQPWHLFLGAVTATVVVLVSENKKPPYPPHQPPPGWNGNPR